jgi:hypothetical protein
MLRDLRGEISGSILVAAVPRSELRVSAVNTFFIENSE